MLSSASTQNHSLPRGHHAFLHRAAHDPQFLDALQADPQAVLAEYGMSVDSEQIPDRVTPPSEESILDVLVDVEDDPERKPPFKWMGFFANG